ncbi:MAG TPA: TrbG/VirB9 family P-type conjugative transfer protein [Steroidobacteraceae bacterium]
MKFVASCGGVRRCLGAAVVAVLWLPGYSWSETIPAQGSIDARVRVVGYSVDQVYRLHGYAGYQIDLQFEPGEIFIGLGSGDLDGISFVAQDNHLFIKPRAVKIDTNLTVLTSRRAYQFDYSASMRGPQTDQADVIYALRFSYPEKPTAGASPDELTGLLRSANPVRNIDYWYCGSPTIKPIAASDDGVHTRLRFGARAEQPAIFVRNDDGTESLLNFSMDAGDVIVHRVVHELVVRRGRLTGRIVNKDYSGSGERLQSGTVSPDVQRTTDGAQP